VETRRMTRSRNSHDTYLLTPAEYERDSPDVYQTFARSRVPWLDLVEASYERISVLSIGPGDVLLGRQVHLDSLQRPVRSPKDNPEQFLLLRIELDPDGWEDQTNLYTLLTPIGPVPVRFFNSGEHLVWRLRAG